MAKSKEVAFSNLERFLPEQALPLVAPHFSGNYVHLVLVKKRKTKLGDYLNPHPGQNFHRITVNINLNPYQFLVTLIHELAHMYVYIRHKHDVAPHGKEWKSEFGTLLKPYFENRIFPEDIQAALGRYIRNPKASTCSDPALYTLLRRYDEQEEGLVLVSTLKPGDRFRYGAGKLYEVVDRRRTRLSCKEVATGGLFLFPGIVEVYPEQ